MSFLSSTCQLIAPRSVSGCFHLLTVCVHAWEKTTPGHIQLEHIKQVRAVEDMTNPQAGRGAEPPVQLLLTDSVSGECFHFLDKEP